MGKQEKLRILRGNVSPFPSTKKISNSSQQGKALPFCNKPLLEDFFTTTEKLRGAAGATELYSQSKHVRMAGKFVEPNIQVCLNRNGKASI